MTQLFARLETLINNRRCDIAMADNRRDALEALNGRLTDEHLKRIANDLDDAQMRRVRTETWIIEVARLIVAQADNAEDTV